MLQNEKILITGPASQVGFPIARELVQHNEVFGLARFGNPADRKRVEALGVKCLAADLASDRFEHVPDDFTYVLNFAVIRGNNFDYDLAANGEGTARLMYHCRKAKAWLQCSSTAVYAYAGQHPLVETDPLGENGHRVFAPTYTLAKIAAETMARFGARQWDIPTIITRLNVPYGDNGGWPAYHLNDMIAGKPILIHPEKPNLYNPLHEDDFVSHIPKLLAAASVPATVVNWGGSQQVSLEDWCTYMGQLTGVQPKFVESDQCIGATTVDLTRMHQLVGPTKVDWHDGLRRMIRARHPELLAR